jgi:hypothetical protein
MLRVVSHFSLFSPFAARQDQNGENSLPCTAIRVTQGKRLSRLRERKAFFANFAFFAIRRHLSSRSSVPRSRIPAGIGGSVKGKRWRVAPRPLTFAAVLPAINPCGRGTEMTQSGACSGNISERKSRERQREKKQRRNPVGLGGAFSASLSPGVISKSQPTFRGHTLTRVPPHGWRVAPPLRTPEKAQKPKGGKS